jgi:hypothetical protein
VQQRKVRQHNRFLRAKLARQLAVRSTRAQLWLLGQQIIAPGCVLHQPVNIGGQ